jgi:hypothetical protein
MDELHNDDLLSDIFAELHSHPQDNVQPFPPTRQQPHFARTNTGTNVLPSPPTEATLQLHNMFAPVGGIAQPTGVARPFSHVQQFLGAQVTDAHLHPGAVQMTMADAGVLVPPCILLLTIKGAMRTVADAEPHPCSTMTSVIMIPSSVLDVDSGSGGRNVMKGKPCLRKPLGTLDA